MTATSTIVPAEHSGRSLDGLKALLLTVLFICTFLMTTVPFVVRKLALHTSPESRRRRYALLFTLLSCFGGGVFLATCLLDLLPDALADVTVGYRTLNIDRGVVLIPLAEFLVAVGFFLVLFTEQVVQHCREQGVIAAGGLEGLLTHDHDDGSEEQSSTIVAAASHDDMLPRLSADESEESPPVDPHFNPDSHSTIRAILLVLALSLHSAFDGLALGVGDNTASVLQLFGALAIHKSVVGFSLGLRLVQSRLTNIAVFVCGLIFSSVTLLGGGTGIIITDTVNKNDSSLVSGCLQSVACGTFLYVTCFEILPHELNQRGNRLTKLLTLLSGFAFITGFIILYPH